MEGDDGLIHPLDPTATGEAAATERVRAGLKRKRPAAGAAEEKGLSAAAAWVPPTAAPKACTHEVALPPGWGGDAAEEAALRRPTYDGPPAKTYPFVLDPFQATAVACLARAAAGRRPAATPPSATIARPLSAAPAPPPAGAPRVCPRLRTHLRRQDGGRRVRGRSRAPATGRFFG